MDICVYAKLLNIQYGIEMWEIVLSVEKGKSYYRIRNLDAICYSTALAHKLAKYMYHIIRANMKFQNHTAIKNSIKLIQNIKEKHIPHNSTLASFDITNLYTNIPTSETLQILTNMLKQNNTPQAHWWNH